MQIKRIFSLEKPDILEIKNILFVIVLKLEFTALRQLSISESNFINPLIANEIWFLYLDFWCRRCKYIIIISCHGCDIMLMDILK